MSTTISVQLREPKKPKKLPFAVTILQSSNEEVKCSKGPFPLLVPLVVNYVVAQQGSTIFVTLLIQPDSFVCQFQSQILTVLTGYFAHLNELHTHMLYLCTTPTMPFFAALHHFPSRTLSRVLILSNVIHRKSLKREISSKPSFNSR